jgi:hypothetical protein
MSNYIKYLCTIIGTRLSNRHLARCEAAIRYMGIGRWMKEHNFRFHHRVPNRQNVWAAVAKQVCNRQVLYLEFGVFQGTSIRYWSRELKHPQAKLHGFDSFEGLPDHSKAWEKGQFNVGGLVPNVDDERVRFFKGWFDRVLPTYSLPEHEVLVVNMDADLYGSTIYVLRYLKSYIRPGSFIYFDEMSQLEHEPRAMGEFIRESGLKFRAVCADQTLTHVFFECLG